MSDHDPAERSESAEPQPHDMHVQPHRLHVHPDDERTADLGIDDGSGDTVGDNQVDLLSQLTVDWFVATPTTVDRGGPTTLTWRISGPTALIARVSFDIDDQNVKRPVAVSGTLTVAIRAGTYFTLNASVGSTRVTLANIQVRITVPPFRAFNASFQLDGFRVDNTRSVDEDTIYGALGVKVDGQPAVIDVFRYGDADNGSYRLGRALPPVLVPNPSSRVAFAFQLVNSGNAAETATNDALLDTTGKLLDYMIASKTVGPDGEDEQKDEKKDEGGGIWESIAKAALGFLVGKLVELLTADCDGLVAAHALYFTGNRLWAVSSGGDPVTGSRDFPGLESPVGCGSNSRYSVTWSFRTMPVAGSRPNLDPRPDGA